MLDDHAQAFFAERLAVVVDVQIFGVDDDATVAFRHGAFHAMSEVAVEHGLGDVVLEMAGVGPLEAGQRVGEQADAPPIALDDVVGIGLRLCVAHERRENVISHAIPR